MKVTKMVLAAIVAITTQNIVADEKSSEIKIKIKNLEVEDNVYTPHYSVITEQDHEQGSAKRWVRIGVEFETSGGWIDILSIRQIVIAKGVKEDQAVELSTEDEYINLNPGDHKVYVYLHPSYVERFEIEASELDSAAFFSINGVLIAEKETNKEVPKGWSKSTDEIVYHGYLLNQSETPFWYVNYDFNEIIKRKPKGIDRAGL